MEPPGLYALKEIVKYIKNDGKRLIALSVVPFHEGDLHLWVFKDFEKEFKKPFEKVLEKIKEIGNEEIVDIALSKNCDLIVLSRKKNFSLMMKLLGVNVTRVIGYSPVDVLVIPQDSKLFFNKILVPMDGSIYSEVAFKKACKIAQKFSSELHLLSVVDTLVEISVQNPDLVEGLYNTAKNILGKVQNTAESLGIKTKIHIREGDPGEKILTFIEEREIETVVMGSYGKTGIKRLLMGSVAEKVLTFTSIPVLISKSLEF